MKKILNFVKNFIIIAYILLIIFVTICLLSYNDYKVTVLGETTILPVIDEDLEPDFTSGDLLLIERNKLASIRDGDKIFFYRKRFGEVTVNYSKVVSMERVSDTETTFTVEGDYKFSSSNYIGKVDTTTVVPKIGKMFSILQSKWGFLFLGVFPSLVAFFFTLHSVIQEATAGDEEPGENEVAHKKKKKKKKDKEITKDDNGENADKKEEANKEEAVKEETKEEIKEETKTEDKTEEKASEETKENDDKKENAEDTIKEEKEEVKTETELKEEKQEEIKAKEGTKEDKEQKEIIEEKPKETVLEEETPEQKKKEAIEAKMKSMTEEEKKALIKAKLESMTEEEKRALIEAKKKKLEAEKNKKGEQ